MKNKEVKLNHILGRYCMLSFKYLPYISAFLIMLHVILGLMGFCVCVSELLIITIATIVILLWAQFLKFCFLHKLFIIYSLSAIWIIYFHRFLGLGNMLEFIRIGYLYFGTLLFTTLIIKFKVDYGKEITDSITKKNS